LLPKVGVGQVHGSSAVFVYFMLGSVRSAIWWKRSQLDDRQQQVVAAQSHGVDAGEVTSHRGLGPQELGPGDRGSLRCWIDSWGLRFLQIVDAPTAMGEALAVDATISPRGQTEYSYARGIAAVALVAVDPTGSGRKYGSAAAHDCEQRGPRFRSELMHGWALHCQCCCKWRGR